MRITFYVATDTYSTSTCFKEIAFFLGLTPLWLSLLNLHFLRRLRIGDDAETFHIGSSLIRVGREACRPVDTEHDFPPPVRIEFHEQHPRTNLTERQYLFCRFRALNGPPNVPGACQNKPKF